MTNSMNRKTPYSLSYIEHKLLSMGWEVLKKDSEYLHLFADYYSLNNFSKPRYIAGGLVLTIEKKSFQIKLSIRAYLKSNLHLNLYKSLINKNSFDDINSEALCLIYLSSIADTLMRNKDYPIK